VRRVDALRWSAALALLASAASDPGDASSSSTGNANAARQLSCAARLDCASCLNPRSGFSAGSVLGPNSNRGDRNRSSGNRSHSGGGSWASTSDGCINDEDALCFWCASTVSCQAACPQLWDPFSACPDPATDARVCGCASAEQSASCGACSERLGCVWLTPGAEHTTAVAMHTSAVRQAVVMASTTDGRGKCWPGGATGPIERSADLLLTFGHFRDFEAVSNLRPREFYWAQCRVQGVGFLGLLLTLAALGALLVCAAAAWLVAAVGRKRDGRAVVTGTRLLREVEVAVGSVVGSRGEAGASTAAPSTVVVVGRAVPTLLL